MNQTFTTESFNAIFDEFKKKYTDLKNTEVKIAITGQSGNGKSSMINGLLGENVAKTGSTETTYEIKSYTHNGTKLYDLPGCGTPNFPIDTYIKKCNLESYDAAIIVTSNRFMENDLWLINEMGRLDKPVYVVRTKMDEATANELRDNGLDELEVFRKILLDLEVNLKNVSIKGIYLVSSVFPQKWDFNKLFTDIGSNLDELKRKRFYADAALISEEILIEKRKVAIDIVTYSSYAAAANGLNPIIGTDVAIDLAILKNMSIEVQEIYKLDDESINQTKIRLDKTSRINFIKTALTSFTGKFILKEGILALLKRYSGKMIAKAASKWIPFIGQIASASIGYKMTRNYGDQLIDDADSIAKEIISAGAESIVND